MNKLISRNPILRFKLGRKIIFALGGNKTYYEVTEKSKIPTTKPKEELRNGYMRINNNGKWAWGRYDSNGNFVPITKEVVLDDGTILNINGTRSTVSARNAAKNPKVIERGYIDSNGNKTLLGTSTNDANKKTRANITPNKVASTNYTRDVGYNDRYGLAGDIQRNWRGTKGVIADNDLKLLLEMGFQIQDLKNAAREAQLFIRDNGLGQYNIALDNAWGGLSSDALKSVYQMWKAKKEADEAAESLKPVVEKPSSTILLPEVPTTPRPAMSNYIYYAKNLKQALGGNNNFSGLSNLVWKEYADDDDSFAANFSRDMRTRFGDYKDQLSWLNNQAAIEKLLNVSGRYRGTNSGDYGDIANSMAKWAGEYNYNNVDKPLNYYNAIIDKYKRAIGGYKMGGLLPSRNIIERFKLGRKINLLEEGGISKKRTTPRKRFVLAASDNSFSREFDTEEEAKAYRRTHKIVGVIRDQKNASNGSVIKGSRVLGKDAETTAYDRLQAEKYNNLSMKEAYKAAQKSGNKYFAYKGKVYKTDIENGKNNMTEMMKMYGNSLGWDKDPKLNTKKSMEAREQYRKSVDAKKGNRNANYQGKTNKLASAEADKKVAKTWNEEDFVDALLPATAVGNGINYLASAAMGEDYHPEVFHSGLNPAVGMANLMRGEWNKVGERALNAASVFGGPWIGRGVKWLGTKMAPEIANLGPKSAYLSQRATIPVTNGTGRTLNKMAERAISGNFTSPTTTYGRYSLQKAADKGLLNQFTTNGGFNNAIRWGNTAVRNNNTGTTYIFRNTVAHPYDAAVEAGSKVIPWVTSFGLPAASTTLHNLSEE